MDSFPNLAARRIRQFRKQRGWTQFALAQFLGRPHLTITGWENGKIPRADSANLLREKGICEPGDFYKPDSAEPQEAA